MFLGSLNPNPGAIWSHHPRVNVILRSNLQNKGQPCFNSTYIYFWGCWIRIRSPFDPITSGWRSCQGQIYKINGNQVLTVHTYVFCVAEYESVVRLIPSPQGQGHLKSNVQNSCKTNRTSCHLFFLTIPYTFLIKWSVQRFPFTIFPSSFTISFQYPAVVGQHTSILDNASSLH